MAEVEIDTGEARRITDVDDSRSRTRARIAHLQRSADGTILLERRAGAIGGASTRQRYRYRGGQWAREAARASDAALRRASPTYIYSIAENINTSPEVSVRDPRTGRERILTDLNPQLRGLSFVKVEAFTWRDRLGRVHRGGLVRPAQYESGERYTIVIQTYGFQDSAFLLEGPPLPGKGVFAAQALANQGMCVLQMPREEGGAKAGPVPVPYEDNGEMPRFMAMLESAIDALDAAGLIDRTKVGLTGFSRSGTQVLHAITFSKHPVAAAVVADGAAITPYAYVS
ncbi:MAG: alpha/beta hydrolase family protein, partial [Solimonas sp.]